ncbi:MAG TPA: hypothetical protein VFW94_11090 [Candidatus Acidoferrales bacterium]|nr:hypothetical protein [Candidatus Acidoferrales bacterium]
MTTLDYFDSPAPGWRTTRNRGFFAALPLLFALAFIWPFSGMSGEKVQMKANASETPAAQGTITVTQGKNGNTKIETKVKNLAKPSGLQNPASVYVLWIQPDGQAAKNEGQIMIDADRNGTLKSETPYKRFQVFITPEHSPTVASPNGPHVLSATVD